MAGLKRQPKSRVARLTWRGWAVLASGLLALVIAYAAGRSELLPLATFLVVLPVTARLYVRFRPLRFAATRQFSPAVLAAGTSSTVGLEIRNLARYSSPVANWRDSWPWQPFVALPQPLESLAAAVPNHIARGSVQRLAYPISPARRGVFEIGPLVIDFTDPFGLADGAISAEGAGRLTVTPTIYDLPEGTVAIGADEGAARLRQRRSFGGEDDLMTREYRQGDAMRRVHWRASAHHGELMVRQEEQRSHAQARIVLDTLRSSYRDARGHGTGDGAGDGTGAESESFEWAVSLCASLSLSLVDRGFVVQVAETGEQQLAAVDRVDEYLESLAAVQLSALSAGRMSALHGSQARGSTFVILGGSISSAAVDHLVAQGAGFDLAVAFIVSPTIFGVTKPSPAVKALRAADWICVVVSPQMTLEAAWHAVGAEQELAHGSP